MKILCVAVLVTMACFAGAQAGPVAGHLLWKFETGG
jgi:hypothetical protein